jgi:hypothetical protein
VTPESLTNRLHDIQDLDPAGVWPLATGWWLIIAGVALMIMLVIAVRHWQLDWRRYLPRYGWSREAAQELTALRERIGHGDAKNQIARLSELLRRVAIARCGRHSCAGLHGESWLDWLAEHDPDGFDWRVRGRLLLEVPYAPPGELDQPSELGKLIDAALVWTVRPSQCRRGRGKAYGV